MGILMNKKLILTLSLITAVTLQPMQVNAIDLPQVLRDFYAAEIVNPENPVYKVTIQRTEKDVYKLLVPITYAIFFTAIGWFFRANYEKNITKIKNNKKAKPTQSIEIKQVAEIKKIQDKHAEYLEIVNIKVNIDPLCE